VAPCPTLSQRAEDVWGVFLESFCAVVGMGVGMVPNRQAATTLASLCGIEATAEFWMLFGDLERAWVNTVNEKHDE
jgi:hypothetical protein